MLSEDEIDRISKEIEVEKEAELAKKKAEKRSGAPQPTSA
jgi:hypothetical protein